MKKLVITAIIGAALAGCSANASKSEPNYTVTVDMAGAPDGTMVYLTDYDTTEAVDSAAVASGKVEFKGYAEKPFVGRLTSGGNRLGDFIVEPGTIEVAQGRATGTELNSRMNEAMDRAGELAMEYNMAPTDSLREAVLDQYNALTDSLLADNADNPIGYMLFVQKTYEMDKPELEAAIKAYPQMKEYKRVRKALDVFERKDATAPGKMFTDFAVEYDGKTQRLSDYVGKGKYTLVDFWASWCGPCRRESKVVKEVYDQYGPKGLDVVGVAVWDEPEASVEAAKQLQMTWPQIINGGTDVTDLYGIMGIPCIILFAPDGTIVARDLQGRELREAVAAAFAD